MGPPVEGLGYFGIIPGGFSVHMFLKLLFKKYYIYICDIMCVYNNMPNYSKGAGPPGKSFVGLVCESMPIHAHQE